jgi:hypothetical protein
MLVFAFSSYLLVKQRITIDEKDPKICNPKTGNKKDVPMLQLCLLTYLSLGKWSLTLLIITVLSSIHRIEAAFQDIRTFRRTPSHKQQQARGEKHLPSQRYPVLPDFDNHTDLHKLIKVLYRGYDPSPIPKIKMLIGTAEVKTHARFIYI